MTGRKQPLSDLTCKNAAPEGKEYVVWDTQTKGFFLKVSPTGRKTFGLYYRTSTGKQRRPKIGSFPEVKTSAAREIAQRWLYEVAVGNDPSSDRSEARNSAELTARDLADRHMREHVQVKKKEGESRSNDERNLRLHILPAIGDRKVSEIGMTVASPEKTRGSIQTVALAHCGIFASKLVACATARTSFSLDDFVAGKPMTIYIVFPPEKLRSHAALLRIWLACLIQLIARRTRAPEQPTTLFVDEAAQLGTLDELRTAITLMRGYGVRLWTFWQDLSQLKSLYPKDWQSILNNSGVIQIFGRNQTLALNEMTSLCDPFCDDFSLFIPPGEQLLLRRDGPSLKATQLDYKYDPAFTGLFDPNPFYQKSVFSQSKADHDVKNRRTFTQDLAPFDLNRGN